MCHCCVGDLFSLAPPFFHIMLEMCFFITSGDVSWRAGRTRGWRCCRSRSACREEMAAGVSAAPAAPLPAPSSALLCLPVTEAVRSQVPGAPGALFHLGAIRFPTVAPALFLAAAASGKERGGLWSVRELSEPRRGRPTPAAGRGLGDVTLPRLRDAEIQRLIF